ncbi:MAG TPA: hypothetical protein VIK33_07550 [Anaerolineae bacterium]
MVEFDVDDDARAGIARMLGRRARRRLVCGLAIVPHNAGMAAADDHAEVRARIARQRGLTGRQAASVVHDSGGALVSQRPDRRRARRVFLVLSLASEDAGADLRTVHITVITGDGVTRGGAGHVFDDQPRLEQARELDDHEEDQEQDGQHQREFDQRLAARSMRVGPVEVRHGSALLTD